MLVEHFGSGILISHREDDVVAVHVNSSASGAPGKPPLVSFLPSREERFQDVRRNEAVATFVRPCESL